MSCFYYFVIIKLLILICFPIFIVISLPPFTLFGFPASCRWRRLFGKKSRYYLVSGWEVKILNYGMIKRFCLNKVKENIVFRKYKILSKSLINVKSSNYILSKKDAKWNNIARKIIV